ncbi:MAG TPA: 50S ribosomal protein L25 [Gemmatimonadales bacterium]|nr:50S ribosomal protein L25 [Gemmatimonadales bacterium]
MAQTVTIAAERRTGTGKGAARQLRATGRVPAVIYGHGRAAESLSVVGAEIEKALIGIAAESTVIDLTIDGSPVKTLIREIQRHPTRPDIIHVDFYEIHADETLTLEVPIRLVGVPDGVRNGGGVLDQVLREIEIEVLPANIPEHVDVDVTDLAIGHSVHVSDLEVPNATVLTDPETTICTVVPPRVEEEVVPAAEVVETEGEEEPELIRKPKAEEEPETEE